MPARVAPRAYRAGNGSVCLICQLPEVALQAVNAAIWDGTTVRVRNYRARGREAYMLTTGTPCDVKTVTAHAEHVESTWHVPTPSQPARSNEVQVFPDDYESLVDASARLSAVAMSKLAEKIQKDELGDRELLGAAKLGVGARVQQESIRSASKQPAIQLTAIFGLASGHLVQLPESEAIDVTPERDLLDAVRAEKAALEAHARGR
jgi:hypothetical protein